jgi:hypothetical protein
MVEELFDQDIIVMSEDLKDHGGLSALVDGVLRDTKLGVL